MQANKQIVKSENFSHTKELPIIILPLDEFSDHNSVLMCLCATMCIAADTKECHWVLSPLWQRRSFNSFAITLSSSHLAALAS